MAKKQISPRISLNKTTGELAREFVADFLVQIGGYEKRQRRSDNKNAKIR